jgi:hypothetical protein
MDRGRTVALGDVHATKLGDAREVWVHYPAAYDGASCEKLPSVVFHDGLESLTRGGFAKQADELYAARPSSRRSSCSSGSGRRTSGWTSTRWRAPARAPPSPYDSLVVDEPAFA